MLAPTLLPNAETEQFGFSYASGPQAPVRRLHRHDEIELGVAEHGSVDAIIGRTRTLIPPERLLVFWASQPHGPVGVDSGTHSHVVHVPLPCLTDAGIPAEFMQRLLMGEVIYAAPGSDETLPDLVLMKHWVHLLSSHSVLSRQIVLHEVIARLLRLASEHTPVTAEVHSENSPKLLTRDKQRHFLKIVQILSDRCAEPWTVQRIADEVGLNSSYAMRLFHEVGGITIATCLTQQRVALAQRLLITTDMKILDVAFECGFASVSSFYEMFARSCGQPPAKYRRMMRSNRPFRPAKA